MTSGIAGIPGLAAPGSMITNLLNNPLSMIPGLLPPGSNNNMPNNNIIVKAPAAGPMNNSTGEYISTGADNTRK